MTEILGLIADVNPNEIAALKAGLLRNENRRDKWKE